MLSRRRIRWIPGRLLVVNSMLAALSVFLTAYIVWEVQRPFPEHVPSRAGQPPASAPVEASLSPTVISAPIIAHRNLFSPSRTELPVTADAAVTLPNPSLHGVVLGTANNPVAYLQDPATNREPGYQIGDPVAGGIVPPVYAD